MGRSPAWARARVVVMLLGLGVLAWWMFRTRPLESVVLGPGEMLVTRPGVEAFVVGDGAGLWRAFDGAPRNFSDGFDLPLGVQGRPALDGTGTIHVLAAAGLLRIHRGKVRLLVPASDLPPDALLEGVMGTTVVVLTVPSLSGRRLWVGWIDSGTDALEGELRLLRRAEGEARIPEGQRVVCSVHSEALAFRGEEGWEAWTFGEDGTTRRVVARGCDRPGALFTPDGVHLLVPGRTDGLWLLSMKDGRMNFMADGNFGVSARVGQSHGFRGGPDVMLFAPQWGTGGYLHLVHTHLSGGGRYQFHISHTHHFDLAVSADGRWLAYGQADFDEQGSMPFEEEVYVFNFESARQGATLLDTREGGQLDQGPAFVGSAASLVYISRGTVRLVHLDPERKSR